MTEVEFVDRYSATGTPTPNSWTACKGHCEGMGVYPLLFGEWSEMGNAAPHVCPQRGEDGSWDTFPPEDGYLFVWCEECGGKGRRHSGRVGDALDWLHTYYYALYWPLWALGQDGRSFYGGWLPAFRQLGSNVGWMWREQKAQRRILQSSNQRSSESGD